MDGLSYVEVGSAEVLTVDECRKTDIVYTGKPVRRVFAFYNRSPAYDKTKFKNLQCRRKDGLGEVYGGRYNLTVIVKPVLDLLIEVESELDGDSIRGTSAKMYVGDCVNGPPVYKVKDFSEAATAFVTYEDAATAFATYEDLTTKSYTVMGYFRVMLEDAWCKNGCGKVPVCQPSHKKSWVLAMHCLGMTVKID